jgi:hypothetical protein
MTEPITYTPTELKLAQQIVADHLFNSLVQAKEGESVRLGSLGKLTKKVGQSKMG